LTTDVFEEEIMTHLETEAVEFLQRKPDEYIPQFVLFTMDSKSSEHVPQEIIPFETKIDDVMRKVQG
jgi:hypothetical protein